MSKVWNFWLSAEGEALTERKNEWRSVVWVLDKLGDIPRSAYQTHQRIFFDGVLEWESLRKDIFGSLDVAFFFMFYHPAPSLDEYMKIYEYFFESAIRRARERFFLPQTHGDHYTEYGLCGGREELMAHALCPHLDYKELMPLGRQLGGAKVKSIAGSVHPIYMISGVTGQSKAVLLGILGYNPYAPGQYLWDHFDYVINHNMDAVEGSKSLDDVTKAMNVIFALLLNFDQREGPHKANMHSIAFKDRLMGMLERGEFSGLMKGEWEKAKSAFGV